MDETTVDEQKMACALADLGMDPEMVEQFIQCFHLRQWERGKRILASHRSKLLSDVHEQQDKLYSIDFLIRKLKSSIAL